MNLHKYILNDLSDDDHITIKVYVNSDCIPNVTASTSNGSANDICMELNDR